MSMEILSTTVKRYKMLFYCYGVIQGNWYRWQSIGHMRLLRLLYLLKITKRIEYKLLSLTYKVLTTTEPSYLYNLITVQPPRSTRSGLTEGNRIFGHTRSSIHIIFFTNNRSFLPVCFPSSLESTSGSPQSTPQ